MDEEKTREQLIEDLERLRRRVEVLEAERLEPSPDNEKAQLLHSQRVLSKTAIELIDFPLNKDIYQFIGDRLRELGCGRAVIVNSFDPESERARVRAVSGLDKVETVLELLGRHPVGMVLPLRGEARRGLFSSKLEKVEAGLYEISFRQIPLSVCQSLEKALNLGDMYAMGFVEGGRLFGSAVLIMPKGTRLKNPQMVETFMGLAAVALRRRQIESSLRESEARYRAISELISDFAYAVRVEPDGSYTVEWATKQQFTSTGYTQEEIYTSGWGSLIHPDDLQIARRHFQTVLSGNADQVAFRIVTRDGDVRWISDHCDPVWDEAEGCVVQIIGAAQDITERRRAEEKIRDLKDFYGLILDNVQDGIWVTDEEDRMVYLNPGMERIAGIKAEDVIGWRVTEDFQPETIEHIMNFYHKAKAEGQPQTYEAEVVTPAGRHTIQSGWLTPRFEDGKYAGMICTVQDITERKRAEEALRKSREHYRIIFENSPISLWEEDFSAVKAYLDDLRAAGVEDFRAYFEKHPGVVSHCAQLVRVIDINRTTLEIFGAQSREEFRGGLGDIFSKEAYPAFKEELIAIAEGRVQLKSETVNRTLEGDRVCLTMNWRVAPGHEKSYSKVLVSLMDITKRKEAEDKIERYAAELERSNQELEQFAYVVSHDLRAPLRGVKSYLQLLEKRHGDQLEAQAQGYIDHAVESAEHMQNMIQALLDLSRVKTRGKEFTPTDVEANLERVISSLSQEIEETNAEITHTPLPTVRADASQLNQVFQNLIANAIKFRREGVTPRVHISASPSPQPSHQGGEGEWLFSVADNGIGIDPEHTERIFHVFQRLHTEDEYPGLGIGLALCKRIIERHGGRIWVESEVGEGATFHFTIPM